MKPLFKPAPRPATFAGIAGLADIRPYYLEALGVKGDVVLEAAQLLKPRGSCVFCGAAATRVFEDWTYTVEAQGRWGKALLRGLLPVCDQCYRLLVLEAGVDEVLEAIVRRNRVSADEARRILAKALPPTPPPQYWRVEAENLELSRKAARVLEALDRLYQELERRGLVYEQGLLTKGVESEPCPPPEDPGLYFDSLRAVGASILEDYYIAPPIGATRHYWKALLPVHAVDKIIAALSVWRPVYTRALLRLDTPPALLVETPCPDNLSQHTEALQLLALIAEKTRRPVEATYAAVAGGAEHPVATTILPPPA